MRQCQSSDPAKSLVKYPTYFGGAMVRSTTQAKPRICRHVPVFLGPSTANNVSA